MNGHGCYLHVFYIYLLHTHTHCPFGTKCSLIRCNCQVRGLVIFCLCTNWSMNAHTTKHFKALSNTHVYLSSSSLPNGYKPLIQTSTVKDCCTADRPYIFSACASKRVIVGACSLHCTSNSSTEEEERSILGECNALLASGSDPTCHAGYVTHTKAFSPRERNVSHFSTVFTTRQDAIMPHSLKGQRVHMPFHVNSAHAHTYDVHPPDDI